MRQALMLLGLLPFMVAATSPSSGPADRKSHADGTAVVCKKFSPPTGTRIGERRICLTNAEWQLLDQKRWTGFNPGTSYLLTSGAPPSP